MVQALNTPLGKLIPFAFVQERWTEFGATVTFEVDEEVLWPANAFDKMVEQFFNCSTDGLEL